MLKTLRRNKPATTGCYVVTRCDVTVTLGPVPEPVPEPTYGERRSATQKQVDAQCVALVEQGIAWLDANVGPSWVDKVDLSRLEMSSGNQCVLGQVFREEGYNKGMSGYEYGTRVMLFCPIQPFGSSSELQEAWLQALRPCKAETA